MKIVNILTNALIAFLATSPLQAETSEMFADRYSDYVETLRKQCIDFEAGEFHAPEIAATFATDFNGDGRTDPIVDESRFVCSSSASMFSGGTGGGAIHVFVSQPDSTYEQFEFLAHGNIVVTPQTRPNRPVLLLSVHSSRCDLIAAPCYASYVWSQDGRFVSTSGAVEASK